MNWCFCTVVLEKTLESPLDCRDIKPVHSKGNQSWIFIGRTDAETEAPILRLPNVKNWLIGKDPDAGKGWRQEEKGMTEDEMVGWHHQLNGHEFEQTPRVGDGQGSLACCSPWGCKESHMTERLNWTEAQKFWKPAGSSGKRYLLDSVWSGLDQWAIRVVRPLSKICGQGSGGIVAGSGNPSRAHEWAVV